MICRGSTFILPSASLIIALANYSPAGAESYYVEQSDVLILNFCNKTDSKGEVFRVDELSTSKFRALNAGECFFDIISDYSRRSRAAYFFSDAKGEVIKISNVNPKREYSDHIEKIFLIMFGALIASLRALIDAVISPLTGSLIVFRKVRMVRRRIIQELRISSEEVKFDEFLDDVWSGRSEIYWIPESLSRQIDEIRDIVMDVASGSVTRVEAIKRLGGEP